MSFIDNDDGYVVFEASDDDEEFESSEDDDDEQFLLWAFGQKSAKSVRSKQADDFEREMNQELSHTIDALCASNEMIGIGKALNADNGHLNAVVKKPEEEKFYDDVYFDSDDEAENDGVNNSSRKRKGKHPVISNDDLFYDPNMDKEDQEWVDRKRRSYIPRKGQQESNKTQKRLPKSDAVLNCPGCMTTLCLDCQRHSLYKNQYRAMFVLSCTVDNCKPLTYPPTGAKKKKFKKNTASTSSNTQGMDADEIYYPVRCSVCNTEVAVQDKDEVYHFFNVLSSFG